MTTLNAPEAPHPQAAAPLPLRERKKAETRTAIHDAALRLVSANGVEHASVDAICSEAGVSTRTFFNYFPSKVSAVVGLSSFEIPDAQRERFLAGDGERMLVRDLCELIGSVMDATTRDGIDREALREVLQQHPEIAPDVIKFAAELRREVVTLAEQRTTPPRALLAVSMVMSAVDCALHRPHDAPDGGEFTTWLFDAVMSMQAIARDSLD